MYRHLESLKNELDAMDAAMMSAFNPNAVEQPRTMGVICRQSSLNTLEKWFERKCRGMKYISAWSSVMSTVDESKSDKRGIFSQKENGI